MGSVGSGLQNLLLALSALFSIVNPIAAALIFAQVTADRSHAERLDLARRVGLYSAQGAEGVRPRRLSFSPPSPDHGGRPPH